MRVLLINYRYFLSGGPERYMFNVKRALESMGHEVVPFSIKSGRNATTEYEPYFAEPLGGQDEAYFDRAKKTPRFAIDVVARLFYSLHVKRRVRKIIDATRPDVAYVLHHYNKLSPSVIDACKERGLKVFVRLSDFFLVCPQAHFLRHDKVCEECLARGLHRAVIHRCVKGSLVASGLKALALYVHKRMMRCYQNVDGFVCTTEFMKSRMEKDGWASEKLHVIPTFSPGGVLVDKDEWAGRGRGGYILYFGRFAKEKGLDLLVNAYLSTDLSERGVKLVLVGGTKAGLEACIEQVLPAAVNIDVKPFLEGELLGEVIREALFVVVPSRWYENLPNVVLEAYAYGKPVIAMKIGSMPEVVWDQETGLLFEREDYEDLAKKLTQLATSADLRMALAQGIAKYHDRFSRERHCGDLMALFEA